jgi:hypothetical protein
MHPKPEDATTPRIAAGVGAISIDSDPDLAKRKEAAMSAAILQALADGISLEDADEIRARILAAAESVTHGA